MKQLTLLILLPLLLTLTIGCGDAVDGNVPANNDPQPDMGMDPTPDPQPDTPACECAPLEICVAGACQGIALPMPGAEVNTTPDPGCAANTVSFVAGYVVDQGGRAVVGAKAQACLRLSPSGDLLCLAPSDSGMDGTFGIVVPDNARCATEVTARVLVPLTDQSTQYCHVELPDAGNAVVNINEPVVLFPTTRATDIPPEGDVNAARTVTFADGLQIDVTPASFFAAGEGYAGLAAGEVDPEGLCFLDGQSLDGLYTFSPEGDVLNGAYPIRIPNKGGLAAGARVSLFVLGGLDCHLADGTLVEEADLEEYGTGTVDEAGEFIVSDESGHLPCFTWFGYRAQ